MSDSSNGRPRRGASRPGSANESDAAPAEGSGVLAGLPRTRPQRASARRAAARASAPRTASRTAPSTATDHLHAAASPASSPRASTPRAATGTSRAGRSRAADAPSRRAASKPKQPSARAASTRRGASAGKRAEQPAPRQGFEAEPESLGGPVAPPGGTELVASAAELAGELAKTGVSTGARLVRDFLSRLPG